jgi:hypothetical protein
MYIDVMVSIQEKAEREKAFGKYEISKRNTCQ